MKQFIQAGENLINTNELLYIVKAREKPLWIAQFKIAPEARHEPDQNSKVFLSKKEYEDFLTNLALAKG